MTVTGGLEQQIRELREQVATMSAELARVAASRTPGVLDQIIRPARTTAGTATYPTSGGTVPIVFLDVGHDGTAGADVSVNERSATAQSVAGSLDNQIVPEGTDGWVARYARRWLFVTSAASIFPVKMTQTGGVDGTPTAQATWTYRIQSAEAVPTDPDIATNVNPGIAPHHFKRFAVGKTSKADYGLARYNSIRPTTNPFGLEIIWCNELLVVEKC